MDEQNSLRGQGFTLMVFGGLVALCAVFFILGMVVGRGQGGSGAPDAAGTLTAGQRAPEEDAGAAEEPEADLGFYEAVTDEAPEPPPVVAANRAPAPPAPRPRAAAPEIPPPPSAVPGALMLQLGAFRAEEPAEALASELRERGFGAVVFRPDPDSGAGFYRVRVGPFASDSESIPVRSELESAGYDVLNVR